MWHSQEIFWHWKGTPLSFPKRKVWKHPLSHSHSHSHCHSHCHSYTSQEKKLTLLPLSATRDFFSPWCLGWASHLHSILLKNRLQRSEFWCWQLYRHEWCNPHFKTAGSGYHPVPADKFLWLYTGHSYN